MKKYIIYLATMAAMVTAVPAASQVTVQTAVPAQTPKTIYYEGQAYILVNQKRPRLIDWRPQQKTAQRYTLAVRPGYFFNSGVKFDFETELDRSGRWLQVYLSGIGSGWYSDYDRQYNKSWYNDWDNGEGWELPITGYGTVRKITGAGAGLAYKAIQGSSGWYFSAGAEFNYYDVYFHDVFLVSFQEDGIDKHEYRALMRNVKYYKPAVNFNAGKHFALSQNLFIDLYAGVGYSHSIASYDHDPDDLSPFDDGSFSIAHRGFYLNGGFRLGWLWGR